MNLEREATLTVNGRAQPYQAQTISDYLSGVGIDPAQPGVAVAVNASIVRRAEWATTLLQPGDQVEIVQARAGG